MSAAGISVDVTSSNASGMSFTFAEGAINQHNSLNLTTKRSTGNMGSASTTTEGVTSLLIMSYLPKNVSIDLNLLVSIHLQ